MGSRAPGGVARPSERTVHPPLFSTGDEDQAVQGKKKTPHPPILPRGLNGPPKPAEDVIKGR
eukprot:5470570-Pyramimonas_sp.AAC.1